METKPKVENFPHILGSFFESLKHERFMAHHGIPQSNWIVFDTSYEATAAFKADGGSKLEERHFQALRSASNEIKTRGIEIDFDRLKRRLRLQLKWIWRQNKLHNLACYSDAFLTALYLSDCIVAWGDPTQPDTRYMLERWNVWQQGFALYGEWKGRLYVFRRA